MAALEVSRQFVDEMIAHALEDDPNECCGILIGENGTVIGTRRVTNIVDEKNKPFRYQMAPLEYASIDEECSANGRTLWGFYHSHTKSQAYPSKTDQNLAFWPGTKDPIWPDSFYLLVSLENKDAPVVRAYTISPPNAGTDGDFRVDEHELRVTENSVPNPA